MAEGRRMSQSPDFAAILGFVAVRMPVAPDTPAAEYRKVLRALQAEIVATGRGRVAPAERERTARALAGIAGFLQREILPETIAHANPAAECQIRAAIDTAMGAVTTLMTAAARQEPEQTEILAVLPHG
jgi:hypothetical protein